MRKSISVESLRGVSIEADDDIFDLAQLLLKIQLAREARLGQQTRTTVYGLAGRYVNLAFGDVSHEEILERFRAHGLPLGATVEPQSDA